MGIFYGKKYNPRNRTFSLENGENFIEGTGLGLFGSTALSSLTIQQGITINFMLHFASARLRNNHMYMMVWLHCYFFS